MKNIYKLKKNESAAANHVELMISSKNYFHKLKELIDNAEYYIHLQTYIFKDDATGKYIQRALIHAAHRGVKIYLLIDAYGSSGLSKEFIKEMTEAGIAFRFYGQLFKGLKVHLSRRMHHKIFVADGVFSIVGGINISDNYNDTPGGPAWLDFAIVCKGPVSMELLLVCLRKWKRKHIKKMPMEFITARNNHEQHSHGCFVYVRENDPLLNKNQVSKTYRKAFRSAEKEIIMVGGYFIPGFAFRQLMKKALKEMLR